MRPGAIRRRRGSSNPASVPATLRLVALLFPLAIAGTSIAFRWPDRLLEDSGVALATVQLALGSLLAWGAADAYIHVRRRRLLIAETGSDPAPGTEAFVRALGEALLSGSAGTIAVRCADDDIPHSVAVVRAAARHAGSVAFECDEKSTARLCSVDGVLAALAIAREHFSAEALARGFRDAEVRQFWSGLLRRGAIVLVARSPDTIDAPTIDPDIPVGLAARGLNIVWVGSTHPLGDSPGDTEFDVHAARLSADHLRAGPDGGEQAVIGGAATLLAVVGERAAAGSSILAKLVAATRLAGYDGRASGRADRTAADLLVDPGFFTPSERATVRDMLQFSSRGIRVLAQLPATDADDWNPAVFGGASGGSFLAVKRAMCLYARELSDDDIDRLRTDTPRSWLLDIIASTPANSSDHARLLLGLSASPDIAVRWSAATQLLGTMSLADPTEFIDRVTRSVDDAEPAADSFDLPLGAAGWLVARMLVRWPERCLPLWNCLLGEAAARDPSHLALSMSRGILLAAAESPHESVDVIAQFRDATPRFWLTDIKLAHAAALCAAAGSAEGGRHLTEFMSAEHPLVRDAARLADLGVRDGRPAEQWTWGIETLEALATAHRQDDDTLRLLADVVLTYGRFLRDGSPLGLPPHDIVTELSLDEDRTQLTTLEFRSPSKNATLRIGPAFCLAQAALARNTRLRRAWTQAARRGVAPAGGGST